MGYMQDAIAEGWAQDRAHRLMKGRATWELRAMVRALSKLSLLNTPEDDARLAEAKHELRLRARSTR